MSNALLTVAIPAFEKVDFVVRAMSSVVDQSYRPIELLVSVDNNSISKGALEAAFDNLNPVGQISARFIYQQKKLGPYNQMSYLFKNASGSFLVFLPHDDWYTDGHFFQNATSWMLREPEVKAVVANSHYENSRDTTFHALNGERNAALRGFDYLCNHLYWELHPAYSAVILCRESLLETGYQESFVRENKQAVLGFDLDEGFECIHQAALAGLIGVFYEPVSIRGESPDSYSKSEVWEQSKGLGSLLPLLRLFNIAWNKRSFGLVRKTFYLIVFRLEINKFSPALLGSEERKTMSMILMLMGFAWHGVRRAYRQTFQNLQRNPSSAPAKIFLKVLTSIKKFLYRQENP